MDRRRILIIEDEENIRMGLEDDLSFEGYYTSSAEDGETGLTMAIENSYDLIILDIMLPDIDGFEVCKRLRLTGNKTPLIMLTAKDHDADKVFGFEIGADDYVTKPFSPRELLARIKALLRRINRDQDPIELTTVRFSDIEINFKTYEAYNKRQRIHLTAYEFALLRLLIKHKDKVLDRSTILDEVWGKDVYVTSRTVDTHIAHLRKKIEVDSAKPVHLISVHGIGYRFRL